MKFVRRACLPDDFILKGGGLNNYRKGNYMKRAVRIGVGGPVGSGKTQLIEGYIQHGCHYK